ncbi:MULTISPECIES: hypothetical protein [unclassified Tenacibaculum]|uniref:hypothetical protein n=1 Tax=unclassified Tenacibaculum TaxID=2635139 RepID=UPI001F285585|nr:MULTISPECIES: hypothetical protein [unclassified Tenacibaculum]MCF2874959.1 hypothetical protein [Tenacibaculum sp. Cn5-1]MCF2935035.1 hypothetical protein [Tenacibaculum sp. Cn5-34]MCG7511523.1 hypothetical protein [Tenacibaculum sp. Cn5-46]
MKRNPNWPANRGERPEDLSHLYKNCFDIFPKKCFFDYISNSINVKIPCSNNNFELKGVYDFTKEFHSTVLSSETLKVLILHISDGTNISSKYKPVKYFIDGKIMYDEIIDPETCEQKNIDFKNTEGVLIIIYNNNIDNLCSTSLFSEEYAEEKGLNFILRRPNEAGGGVIVGNP